MSLIAAEIERRGIPTACIVLLANVAELVRPPRALWVPFAHGYPLGAPHDAECHKDVMMSALELIEGDGPPPVLASYAVRRG